MKKGLGWQLNHPPFLFGKTHHQDSKNKKDAKQGIRNVGGYDASVSLTSQF
jgi:hypothetical protein